MNKSSEESVAVGCPLCGHLLRADRSLIGSIAKCPKCQGDLKVDPSFLKTGEWMKARLRAKEVKNLRTLERNSANVVSALHVFNGFMFLFSSAFVFLFIHRIESESIYISIICFSIMAMAIFVTYIPIIFRIFVNLIKLISSKKCENASKNNENATFLLSVLVALLIVFSLISPTLHFIGGVLSLDDEESDMVGSYEPKASENPDFSRENIVSVERVETGGQVQPGLVGKKPGFLLTPKKVEYKTTYQGEDGILRIRTSRDDPTK
jgi:hypothetical protein